MSDRPISITPAGEAQFLPVWQMQASASAFRPSPIFASMEEFASADDHPAPLDFGEEDHFDEDLLIDEGPSQEELLVQAYDQGVADGIAQAQAEMQASEGATEALAKAITALRPQLSQGLCAMLLHAMKQMLERSSGFAEPDAAVLEKHCRSLATLVTRDMRSSALHLHPDDLKLLGDAECGLVLTPDPSIRRGTVSLNHADGWIEQGTQPMLDALQGLIDDLEGDQ
jgi:flagellar biosynthesis/type III secretory pathway protein FliH